MARAFSGTDVRPAKPPLADRVFCSSPFGLGQKNMSSRLALFVLRRGLRISGAGSGCIGVKSQPEECENRSHLLSKRLLFATRVELQRRKREKFDSESDDDDSDDECEQRGHLKKKGDSAFWQRKMRTLHRLLDVNKDGVFSFDDFRLLADKFTSLGHLSQKHHDEFEAKIQEAWELQRGAVHPYNLVTTEQFLEDMHHILNDKRLRRKVHQFLPYFFKAVDKDRNGEISVEEFKLFFKCLGLSESDAEKSFRAIDLNMDGRLSLKEFVKLGRDYLVSENENNISKYFWGPLADS